jgi:hypothetical protein
LYLLRKDGQSFGPFSEDEIRELLNSGSINTLTEASLEGSDNWQPISKIIGNVEVKAPANFNAYPGSYTNQPVDLYYNVTNNPNGLYNPLPQEEVNTYTPNHPPTGVIVIAVLYGLAAFGCLLGMIGCIFLQFGSKHLISSLGSNHVPMAPLFSTVLNGLGAFIGVIAMLFGTFYGFIAYGLYNLRNWARVTVMVLSGLGLLSQLRTCLFLNSSNAPVLLTGTLISTAIFVLIIYYLSQQRIKIYFN